MIEKNNENLNIIIVEDTHNIIKNCVINTLVVINRDNNIIGCVIGKIDYIDRKRIVAHTGH